MPDRGTGSSLLPRLAGRSVPWPAVVYGLAVGIGGSAVLVWVLLAEAQPVRWLHVLAFSILSFLVQRSSFHLGSPATHSLAGVIDLGAVLALGPTQGAVVAVISGFSYLTLRTLRHHGLSPGRWLELPLFNAGLKAVTALVTGLVYRQLGGSFPLESLDLRTGVAFGVSALLWFTVDHVSWAARELLAGGRAGLRRFIDLLPQAVAIELLPLSFSVVVALVLTRLGWGPFGVLSLAIVAVAILAQRWADARGELLQRLADLSTIDQVASTIAQAQLDVDEICRLMYDCASQAVDATIFHLGLFEGDDYTLRLRVRDGEVLPAQTFRLEPGAGLVNWLRESKQPVLVRDFLKEMDSLPARPVYVSDDPPRSALFMPLIAGEAVIGTLAVQSFRKAAYGGRHLRVLSAMANQAALAIQKAQLYDREHKRARQLEVIGEVSRQVTATLDLPELYQRVVHLVRDAFGYYYVSVCSVDAERQRVTFEASASAYDEEVTYQVEWGQGLIGWVAVNGEAVVVNDVESDSRYRCLEALDETKSELAAPLVLDGVVVGVLDVQSDKAGAFGQDDLFILGTLGTQIAIAIQEARLYEAERQQAWLSTALVQVADAMSRVSDMDDVLRSIVRLTPILAGVDRCSVLLWDDRTERFVPAQTYGLDPELRDRFSELEFPEGAVPALDLVRFHKDVLLVSAHDEKGLFPPELVDDFDIREVVLLPLLAQGELLGVMMVDYAGRTHHFSPRVIGMLGGIANQAAIVIQSARLVQAQREEAYVSAALLQVAEAVSRSTDLDETMATVVRITPLLVGVEACALFVRDSASGAFLPFQQYGLRGEDRSAFRAMRLAESDPLVRKLAAGSPFVDPQSLPGASELTQRWGGDSLLVWPLAAKGEVLGMMAVDVPGSAQRFTQRWMNILSGIAGQAAIAVENHRLMQEAAEQERLKQELAVAHQIQVSFLPESCPEMPGWDLWSIWRSARQVGGDFYDFIPLPPGTGQPTVAGRLGLVIADVADKGVPAALFMALSRTLMRTMASDGRSPADAAARANDLIVADARSDLFVTLFYAILEPDSGQVTYVSAGHVPPLVVRHEDGGVEELRHPSLPLGIMAGVRYEERRFELNPGDSLVLYTDGVTEAVGGSKEMYGPERLSQVLTSHRHKPARKLAAAVDHSVSAFVGEAAQFDDFTLVVAKYTG